MNHTFSVLITNEKNWYVARCPELDVTSQGKTIEKAKENLKEAVELYVESFVPLVHQHQEMMMPINCWG